MGSFDKLKSDSGTAAFIIWIISGVYLYLSHGGLFALISFQSLLFIVGGSLAATLLFGWAFYLATRGTTKISMLIHPVWPGPGYSLFLRLFGACLFIAFIYSEYKAAKGLYLSINHFRV